MLLSVYYSILELDKAAMQDEVKRISEAYSQEQQKLDLVMKIQKPDRDRWAENSTTVCFSLTITNCLCFTYHFYITSPLWVIHCDGQALQRKLMERKKDGASLAMGTDR